MPDDQTKGPVERGTGTVMGGHTWNGRSTWVGFQVDLWIGSTSQCSSGRVLYPGLTYVHLAESASSYITFCWVSEG
jgi:hypothetical protein